ncbi:MAG: extracellular solute-binding protein [Patescibacteria group bacterium]
MSNLRPFQVIILAVFGLAALIGLVVFASFQGFGRTDKDVGSVTIWGTLPQRDLEVAMNEFKRLHKEYALVTYVERPAATFDTDIANAIASGTGPDLILLQQEHLAAERARLSVIPFSSISERDYRDVYLPAFSIFLTADGSYGIPLLVDPIVLYYNKDALASAGVATPPRTWEAVTGLTPTLTRSTDAGTITRSAIALGGYDNVMNAHAIISLLFFQSGQSIVEGGRAALSRGGESYGVSTAESALNFYSDFANPSKTTYTWNRSLPTSRLMFATGDLVFYLGFASERDAIVATNPNLAFDMAAVPQPGTASTRSTYGRIYALAVPKASKNPNGAYEVALALTQSDVLPLIARGAGMAPGVRSLLIPATTDLYEPVYYPEALVARGWLSPAPATLDAIFAAMIGNVTSGRMNTKEALTTADQALTAALSQ